MLSQRSRHQGSLATDDVAAPTLSLDDLHQLVQKRAVERKKPTSSLASSKKESTQNQKGKKQICLQEEKTTEDNQKKNKKHKRKRDNDNVGGSLESKKVKSSAEHEGKLENVMSKAAHRKTDSASCTLSEESVDNSVDLGKESMTDVKTSNVPSAVNSNGPLAVEEDKNSMVVDSDCKGSTFDSVPGLEPLSHKQYHSQSVAGKTLIQRKLPSWILHSEIIEEDIRSCSKPVSDFLLPGIIIKNLSKMGVAKLFPVQAHVIPELLSSSHGPLLTGQGGAAPRDVCVCAPTGCGKTLCYVLPIVSALLNRVVCQVRAIVIVPSQELAVQVQQVFKSIVQGTGLKTGIVCGGTGLKAGTSSSQASLENECEMLFDRFSHPPASCVDIVIATPGRLVEHINKSSFATLSSLRYLVVDEADKLLDQTFNQWLPKLLVAIATDKSEQSVGQLKESLEDTLINLCEDVDRLRLLRSMDGRRLSKVSRSVLPIHSSITYNHPVTRSTSPLQKLLFSATMSYNPEHLAALGLHQPKLFTIDSALLSRDADTTYTLPQQLEEVAVNCSLEEKPLVLLHLVTSSSTEEDKGEKRVLCFTNSRESTHRLFLLLQSFGVVTVAEMSGSVSQGRRKEVLTNFKKGKTQMLICSDQMARGMDVEEVSCVVNYEPPRKFQTYLHRAGRTARAGQRGVVYTLLARDEVHQFRTMLRQVNSKRKLQEKTVTPVDLQPFREQYPDALKELKSKLN